MQVRQELRGPVVARAACAWETVLGDRDQAAFPLLCALDPYGDAVFNRGQIPALLRELERLPPERGGAWVDEVRALGGWCCRRCISTWCSSAIEAVSADVADSPVHHLAEQPRLRRTTPSHRRPGKRSLMRR